MGEFLPVRQGLAAGGVGARNRSEGSCSGETACPRGCTPARRVRLPGWLRQVLPPDTAVRWQQLPAVVPASALLVGGTALAALVRHRVSRDLDFFVTTPFEPAELARKLSALAPFAVTFQDERTLNGVLGSTKVQFLEALDQRFVEPPVTVEGLRVAGIGDLLATKLKVIQDRGEHRDYFDIKVIEQRGRRDVETGLLLFTQHYALPNPAAALVEVVRGLGYHGDLEQDPAVPEPLAVTTGYWQARVPELLRSLDRTGRAAVPLTFGPVGTGQEAAATVRVEGYTRADGTTVRGYTRRR